MAVLYVAQAPESMFKKVIDFMDAYLMHYSSKNWYPTHHTGLMMATKSYMACGLLALSATAFAAEPQFGLLKMDGAGHATLIVAQPLTAGHTVSMQYPNARRKPVCCKRVGAGAWVRVRQPDVVATNEVTGEALVVYTMGISGAWAREPFVGAAVVGQRLQVAGDHGVLMARTRAGAMRKAAVCVSQEGVHLKETKRATEITHLYLGLGYQVERPDCP